MDKQDQTELLEEAAMIFLAVSEDPENSKLVAERDTFLAKSEAHRHAYRKVETGWRVSGGRTPSRLPIIVPFILTLFAASYFTWDPLRIALTADFSTSTQDRLSTLGSGDLAHLDAGSAIADDTRFDTRSIDLLRGSAFFDVVPDERPFVVSAGPVEITVVGTAFETTLTPDGVAVSVAEGIVEVTGKDLIWELEAGDYLFLRDDGTVEERRIAVSDVATWRSDQLVVNDMSIRQVAAMLDRRMKGRVLVLGGTWANARVSGTFDLEDPVAALKTLAVIGNARLINGAPALSVLMPKG
ncbi:MAG: FecR domain-containing protein [Pseudomonadota bacterium]